MWRANDGGDKGFDVTDGVSRQVIGMEFDWIMHYIVAEGKTTSR